MEKEERVGRKRKEGGAEWRQARACEEQPRAERVLRQIRVQLARPVLEAVRLVLEECTGASSGAASGKGTQTRASSSFTPRGRRSRRPHPPPRARTTTSIDHRTRASRALSAGCMAYSKVVSTTGAARVAMDAEYTASRAARPPA